MNAKLRKVNREIDSAMEKIAEWQERVKLLNQEKIELENLEIVGMVRGMKVSSDDIEEVMKVFTEFYKNGKIPKFEQEEEEEM